MNTISLQSVKEFLEKQVPKSDLKSSSESEGGSFMDYLKNSFLETNESQKTADKMAQEISTGKSENIHETMLALSHAELNFNFMVQVRNKVVESYQEIMRMQV